MLRFGIRKLGLAVGVCVFGTSVPASAAIQVVNGNFIVPTAFNGFEGIGPHGGASPAPPWKGPYTEGGITVQSVGGDKIITTYQHEGMYSWYDGSGTSEYTDFKMADSGAMNAFQFDVTGQFIIPIGAFPPFYYQLLLNGTVVASGSGGSLCDTINICFGTYGFRGGLFDEVRLQTNIFDNQFNASRPTNVLLFDNIFAREVPEPSTWGLMLLGFGIIGLAMRRSTVVRTTISYA